MACSKGCMKTWVVLSQLALLGLGALIIYFGHYLNNYIVASVQTPFLTVGSVFIASSLVLLLSTIFAERCIISRLLVCVFGLVLVVLMISEFAIGGAGVYGIVNADNLAHGNIPTRGPLADIDYTLNSTWTACCTHNYNITLEYDMPPHPKDGKAPHSHNADHHSPDWLQVDVDEANNKLVAHADVEEICQGLERLYADIKTDFNCVDYSQFRSTFMLDIVNKWLIIIQAVAFVAAIMSLVTVIFSCKLACAARQQSNADINGLYSSSSDPLMRGQQQQPVVYTGVNYA